MRKRRPALSIGFFLCLSLYAPGAIGAADATLDRAYTCLDFMQYDEAARLLGVVLEKNPKQKGIRVDQAYAYFRLNRSERAVMVLHRELELFPGEPEALILLSFVEYKRGRLEEAERAALEFNSVLEKLKFEKDKIYDIIRINFPNSGLPDYILGLIEKKRGNWDSASMQFALANERGYSFLDCDLQTIDIASKKEDWTSALALCGEAFDPDLPLPDDLYIGQGYAPEIYVLQSYVNARRGNLDRALNCLKKAASLRPYETFILKDLAILHLEREMPEAAASVLRTLVLLSPADFQARLFLEQAERRSRNVEQGRGLSLIPEFMASRDASFRYVFKNEAKAVAQKANVNVIGLIKEGLLIKAVAWLKQFVEIYDLSPTLYYNLAQLCNSLNIRGEAIRYAFRAIELQPDYRDALDLMGNLCLKIRDLAASVRYYEEAVKVDPQDAWAYYNLGCAEMEAGDSAKAEANWKTAILKEGASFFPEAAIKANIDPLKISVRVIADPVTYQAAVALGNFYKKQGRLDDAYDYYDLAIRAKPKNFLPYYEAAQLLLDRGEVTKAKLFFEKYLALGGDESKIKAFLSKSR